MSDSVRPHPWDSPGKNTGVGCHFLLQCIKVKSESEVAQSCLTLRDPMDCSLPGSSVHGIFQARVLEWVPLPSPAPSTFITQRTIITRENIFPSHAGCEPLESRGYEYIIDYYSKEKMTTIWIILSFIHPRNAY